jgi:small subunit ribosomal protein S16
MAVKIRLRRTGRKKQPSYRLVVAESDTPREGRYLDSVGTYNPLTRPSDLRVDLEKVDSWLARGARMSDTVASLIRKARKGGDKTIAVRGVGPEEKQDLNVVDAPAAPAPAEKPKAGSRGAPKADAPAPAADAAPEAAADAAPQAAAEAAPEAAAEAAPEAAAEAAPEAAAGAAPEAAAEAAPEAAAEAAPEAAAEAAPEAATEPADDTASEPTTRPAE